MALALGGCAVSPDPLAALQSLADTRYSVVDSASTGHRYHVYVRLPDGYDDGGESYPVVYLLDGGAMFPKLAGFYHYLWLGEELPPLILVGISYGSDRFEDGNYRASDFTAPSAERDYWGDAWRFQTFLADELIPSLEARYRMRPDRRVLFGQSLGGQFVLFSALDRPELFWGRIASNPALHRNLEFFTGHPLAPAADERFLFVGTGEFDAPVFREPAMQWLATVEAAPALPWRLESRVLDGESHFSAAPAAFRQGLAWMFGAIAKRPGQNPGQ